MTESNPLNNPETANTAQLENDNIEADLEHNLVQDTEPNAEKDKDTAKKLRKELVVIWGDEEDEKPKQEKDILIDEVVNTSKETIENKDGSIDKKEGQKTDDASVKKEGLKDTIIDKKEIKKEDKKPEKKDDKKDGGKKDGKFKKLFKKLGMGIGIGIAGFFGAMEYFSDLIHGKSDKKDDKKK